MSCTLLLERWGILHTHLGQIPSYDNDKRGKAEVDAITAKSAEAYNLVDSAVRDLLTSIDGVSDFHQIVGHTASYAVDQQIYEQVPLFVEAVTQVVVGDTVTASALHEAARLVIADDLTALSADVAATLVDLIAVMHGAGWGIESVTQTLQILRDRTDECVRAFAEYDARVVALPVADPPPGALPAATAITTATPATSPGQANDPSRAAAPVASEASKKSFESTRQRIASQPGFDEYLDQLDSLPYDDLLARVAQGDVDALDALLASGRNYDLDIKPIQ
jgi:hypothetical protein